MLKPPFFLRVWSKADLSQAAMVYSRAFADSQGEAALSNLLQMKGVCGFCMVESTQEEVVAFVLAHRVFEEAEVLTLAVDPAVQGQGLAFMLMQAVESRTKAEGAAKMFLEVAVDNVKAKALYTKLGYKQFSLRKGYYRRAGAIC